MSGAAQTKDCPLTIMLVVGEPSGDDLGGQVMAGIKEIAATQSKRVNIVGVGGEAMSREGLQSLFSLDDTSVMGLREVVPRIPKILQRVREAVDFALRTHPDLLVVIDSPDFTHRVARGAKKRDPSIRTANYVAPQVWASRAYRARQMARYIDTVLTLFPFEGRFFEQYGIAARFVGYPVVERGALIKGGADFRVRHAIVAETPLLAVLPGSRRNELRFILPVFKRAAAILAKQVPGLSCVIPTLPHLVEKVREATQDWPTPLRIVSGQAEKFSAFDAADAALAASGTVTTELALARTPMVVGYRVGWLTHALARRLLRVPYIVLINLVLNREAVPEFLQEHCTPELLAEAVRPLLTDPTARAAQQSAQEEALRAFGEAGEAPSRRAARTILELAEGGATA